MTRFRSYTLALLVLVSGSLGAEEILIGFVDGYNYNTVFKGLKETQIAIKYDTDESLFYFVASDWLRTAWIHFTTDDVEQSERLSKSTKNGSHRQFRSP